MNFGDQRFPPLNFDDFFVVKFTPNYILVEYFWNLDTRQKFMREGGKQRSPEVTPTPIISIGGPPIFTDKKGILIPGQKNSALLLSVFNIMNKSIE